MKLDELNSILARGENIRTGYKEANEMLLAEMQDPDTFLYKKGSSWMEKGGKLKTVRMNNVNELQFNDFKKGASWAEKGGKLLPNRTLHIIKILILCLAPVKIEEVKVIMSYGSREKLRELYLIPLKMDGLIAPMIKDKPNSPEQKYRLT